MLDLLHFLTPLVASVTTAVAFAPQKSFKPNRESTEKCQKHIKMIFEGERRTYIQTNKQTHAHSHTYTHTRTPAHIDVRECVTNTYICLYPCGADHETIPSYMIKPKLQECTHTHIERHSSAYPMDHMFNSCYCNRHSASRS